jgi:hypothetical protein
MMPVLTRLRRALGLLERLQSLYLTVVPDVEPAVTAVERSSPELPRLVELRLRRPGFALTVLSQIQLPRLNHVSYIRTDSVAASDRSLNLLVTTTNCQTGGLNVLLLRGSCMSSVVPLLTVLVARVYLARMQSLVRVYAATPHCVDAIAIPLYAQDLERTNIEALVQMGSSQFSACILGLTKPQPPGTQGVEPGCPEVRDRCGGLYTEKAMPAWVHLLSLWMCRAASADCVLSGAY